MAGKKQPPTQWPFPRDITRKITAPAYEDGDTADDARAKWYVWLDTINRLRQMDLPARPKRKEDK
jgi:hypothetical protein